MVEVIVMPSALQDVQGIIKYIHKQSVQNAEKLFREFNEKIESLQHFPERGNVVKEMSNPQLREIKLYHYRIIYRCASDKVEILTVHHSARMLINNPHLGDLI